MEWKVDLIEEMFDERDRLCILAISLTLPAPKDELTWDFAKDGQYTIKTAYMLGKGGNLDNFHRAWVDIWSLAVSPKVRHFLWCLCTNTLPVRALLQHRYLDEDVGFPWDYGEAETNVHAIFGCSRFEVLWQESGCAELGRLDRDLSMCNNLERWKQLDKQVRVKGAFLMWCIW
ncbi:uncharacterized protein LOC125492611 [Beta vulgaris subsp. vulgaris]|uniref:uncharacterized protein LOC125492611 n=1 Tax=Beta vulgaris subsp. vulgaris TaxID=3555 RepID=UPI002036DCAE|nr:uncharacterized protein LOC125492611 [Beta vulgaris subsp. vulgaris]